MMFAVLKSPTGVTGRFACLSAIAIASITISPAVARNQLAPDPQAAPPVAGYESHEVAEPQLNTHPKLDVAFNAGYFTDYRFRGVSQTRKNGEVQGGVDLTYPVSDHFGLYLGNWDSSLNKHTGYGTIETDLYGGVTGKIGPVGWKAGAIGYLYPNRSKYTNYYEVNGEVNGSIGPVSAALGTYVAPKQENYGNRTGIYVYSNASYAVPKTPVTLKAGLGYERSATYTKKDGGPGRKLDWNIGATVNYKIFTFGLSYIDTNRRTEYESWKNEHSRNASSATVVANVGVLF